eukprot:1978854-Rhodomonas_salina.3
MMCTGGVDGLSLRLGLRGSAPGGEGGGGPGQRSTLQRVHAVLAVIGSRAITGIATIVTVCTGIPTSSSEWAAPYTQCQYWGASISIKRPVELACEHTPAYHKVSSTGTRIYVSRYTLAQQHLQNDTTCSRTVTTPMAEPAANRLGDCESSVGRCVCAWPSGGAPVPQSAGIAAIFTASETT